MAYIKDTEGNLLETVLYEWPGIVPKGTSSKSGLFFLRPVAKTEPTPGNTLSVNKENCSVVPDKDSLIEQLEGLLNEYEYTVNKNIPATKYYPFEMRNAIEKLKEVL